jgi:RsiW-degrading membrane proteinase PrsW (M82 family)
VTAQPVPVNSAPAPRWAEQTGFVQRHQPAFWLFVILLGLTGLDFLSQQLQMISAAPTAWFVTVILLVPYAIPVIAVIYYLDLYEREPVSILVAALLWGGITSVTFSMYTNTPLMEVIYKLTGDANFTNEWSAALTAPFVEELYKGLGVVLLIAIARKELDDVLDGFVWGAMVGIGFLLVEDVLYFVRAFAETGEMASVFQMFMIRILGAGPYSHFLYTGLVGMGLAYYVVRTDKPQGTRLLTGAGLVAAGVAAHFFWNSPIFSGILGPDSGIVEWFAYVTLKGLPALIGLVLIIRLARNRERRWFASLAAGFHDDGCITPDEITELAGLRSRRSARNAAGRAKGPEGKRLKGRIQREQIGLAMVFSRHGSEQHPEVARHMAGILALKAELAALGSGVSPAAAGWVQPAATAAQPAPQPSPAWGGPVAAAPVAAVPVAVQPAPIVQPAPPALAPVAPAWAPTHVVPAGGLPAWAAPNPAVPPVVTLAAGLDVILAERAGDWARVVAVNGWTGWVDARRLPPRG